MAVHLEPMKPLLTAPGIKSLELNYDDLLSSVAFNFNLRRYNVVDTLVLQADAISPDSISPDDYEQATLDRDALNEVALAVSAAFGAAFVQGADDLQTLIKAWRCRLTVSKC